MLLFFLFCLDFPVIQYWYVVNNLFFVESIQILFIRELFMAHVMDNFYRKLDFGMKSSSHCCPLLSGYEQEK